MPLHAYDLHFELRPQFSAAYVNADFCFYPLAGVLPGRRSERCNKDSEAPDYYAEYERHRSRNKA